MTTIAANDSDRNAVPAAVDRARNRLLTLPDLFQIAEHLMALGRTQDAAELYKTWIAFNADGPLVHLASFNLSIALRQSGDMAGAINALRACIKQDPCFGQAHINLGRTLEDCGQIELAVRQWQGFAELEAGITAERATAQRSTGARGRPRRTA